MTSVRSNSVQRAFRAVFNKLKTGGSGVCLLMFTWIFCLMTLGQSAAARPVFKSNTHVQPINTPTVKEGFDVRWSAPKFVKFIGKQFGRFLIEGKAKPGIIAELEPNAVAIDSQNNIQNLTFKDLAPKQTEIIFGPSGRIKFILTLPFKHVEVPIKARDGLGNVRHYIIAMLASKSQILSRLRAKEKSKMHSRLKVGVEARSVSYTQTNLSHLTETMFAIDFSYQRQLAKRWSFRAQSFVDVAGSVPFSTGQNNLSARFLGFDSHVIYSWPTRPHKWSVGAAGGLYYMTMSSTGQNFGFHNLWGIDLFPVLRYELDAENKFNFYFKYAPNCSQFSPNFNSHEAAAGAEWTKLYSNKRSVSVKLELLQDVFFQNGESGNSTAVNLGVSYGVP